MYLLYHRIHKVLYLNSVLCRLTHTVLCVCYQRVSHSAPLLSRSSATRTAWADACVTCPVERGHRDATSRSRAWVPLHYRRRRAAAPPRRCTRASRSPTPRAQPASADMNSEHRTWPWMWTRRDKVFRRTVFSNDTRYLLLCYRALYFHSYTRRT